MNPNPTPLKQNPRLAEKESRDLSPFSTLTEGEQKDIRELGPKEYERWRYLAERLGTPVCRECCNQHLNKLGKGSGQPAATIRSLRKAGYLIPELAKRPKCQVHGTQTHDQLVTLAPLEENTRSRWSYSELEKRSIRKIIGDRDAFDQDRSAKHEIDHRVPRVRAAEDEAPIDVTDVSTVQGTFMPLTSQHNLAKSRACESCVKTGQRPPSIQGISFWPVGGKTYDPAVGCNGCFWAYPETWYKAVAAHLPNTEHTQQG